MTNPPSHHLNSNEDEPLKYLRLPYEKLYTSVLLQAIKDARHVNISRRDREAAIALFEDSKYKQDLNMLCDMAGITVETILTIYNDETIDVSALMIDINETKEIAAEERHTKAGRRLKQLPSHLLSRID